MSDETELSDHLSGEIVSLEDRISALEAELKEAREKLQSHAYVTYGPSHEQLEQAERRGFLDGLYATVKAAKELADERQWRDYDVHFSVMRLDELAEEISDKKYPLKDYKRSTGGGEDVKA